MGILNYEISNTMKKTLLLLLLVPLVSFGQKSYNIPEFSNQNEKLAILRMDFVDFARNNIKDLHKKLKSGRIKLKSFKEQNSKIMDAFRNANNILYKINLQDNNLDKLPSIITMIYENGEYKFQINNRYINASELYRFL